MRQSMRKIFPKISFSKDPYNNRRQYITYMANGYREILFYDCMDLYRFHNICDKAHDIISIFMNRFRENLNRIKMICI